MAKKQSNKGEIICGATARKYLNCNKSEFEDLVSKGAIQAYRDEANQWRVVKDSVMDYMKKSLSSTETCLVINENHYQEVLQRVCAATSSIKIMTGDFKRFNLKPSAKLGKDYKDGTPFVKYLMDMAVHGISVQIICSRPSSFFMAEWNSYYEQMNCPKLFEFMFCTRNHAKAVIIDDKLVYVGSANVTPAGMGQGIFTPGNFELGILTENQAIVSSIKELFSKIWADSFCKDCHRADKCRE